MQAIQWIASIDSVQAEDGSADIAARPFPLPFQSSVIDGYVQTGSFRRIRLDRYANRAEI